MRCKPWRWLWGGLPVLALGWFAVFSEHERIEADLQTRAGQQLADAGSAWAAVTFTGRDAVLTGLATDEGEPLKALELVLQTRGVRAVESRASLIERADHYVWAAGLRENRVKMSGFVPSNDTRKALVGVAKASFPNREIDDRMKLARGEPSRDAWLGGISFALKQLSGLKRGQVDLDGLQLSVSGEAEDAVAYKSIKAALASGLPQGVKLKAERVTPPVVSPYTWGAKLSNAQLVLSGHAPSEEGRESIVRTARKALSGGSVVDRMEIGDGAPEGMLALIEGTLRELGQLEEGLVEVKDLGVAVTGLAATDKVAEGVRRNLHTSLPAAFRISDHVRFREVALKTVSPYILAAAAEGARLTLTGSAPTEAARTGVVEYATARFAGRVVDNQLQLAAGAPEGFQSCVEAGLAALARLDGGRMQLTGAALEVTGTTEDDALAAALPAEVRAAAAGACGAQAKVGLAPEPALTWRAAWDGKYDLALSGQVSSEAIRRDLEALARELFRSARVANTTVAVEGGSASWPKAAEAGLRALAKLRRGELRLERRQISLTGEVSDPDMAPVVRQQLARDLPRGYRARDAITVRAAGTAVSDRAGAGAPSAEARLSPQARAEPAPAAQVAAVDPKVKAEADACQKVLHGVAREGVIRFRFESAELEDTSHPTLSKLARAANSCPAMRIQIEGHTDADGPADYNQRLSEERAQAVVDYLAKAGVDSSRMQAVGYGQTRPIAPNDTVENKAKNRRIEFVVRAN